LCAGDAKLHANRTKKNRDFEGYDAFLPSGEDWDPELVEHDSVQGGD